VVAKAPGKPDWSKTVDIVQGPSTQTVTVPALEAAVVAQAPDTKPVPSERSPSRITPLVVTFGVVTVVSAGVGTYFGLRAASKNSDAETACPGGLCRGDGLDLDRDARRSATISTIAFSVTLAAAIGTVWTYATSKTSDVQVGLAPNGLAIRGVF
jgi:serine/threonine-protein kinase